MCPLFWLIMLNFLKCFFWWQCWLMHMPMNISSWYILMVIVLSVHWRSKILSDNLTNLILLGRGMSLSCILIGDKSAAFESKIWWSYYCLLTKHTGYQTTGVKKQNKLNIIPILKIIIGSPPFLKQQSHFIIFNLFSYFEMTQISFLFCRCMLITSFILTPVIKTSVWKILSCWKNLFCVNIEQSHFGTSGSKYYLSVHI